MLTVGGTLRASFVTTILSTGSEADADSLPTAVLRRNGAVVVEAVVTVTARGDGEYHVDALIDSEHSWANGDFYELTASWEAETIPKRHVIAQGYLGAVLTAQQIRDALKLARSSGDPAANSIDVVLDAIETNTRASADFIPWTVRVLDSQGSPLGGAAAWVSTDQSGENIVEGTKYADDFGDVTFYLNVGTYYLWRDHRDVFINDNPLEMVVIR